MGSVAVVSNRFSNTDRMDGDLNYIPDYKYELFEISSLREGGQRGETASNLFGRTKDEIARGKRSDSRNDIRVAVISVSRTEANERFSGLYDLPVQTMGGSISNNYQN